MTNELLSGNSWKGSCMQSAILFLWILLTSLELNGRLSRSQIKIMFNFQTIDLSYEDDDMCILMKGICTGSPIICHESAIES